MSQKNNILVIILALVVILLIGGVGQAFWGFFNDSNEDEITVYSGSSEDLIGPLFDKFTEETGVKVNARYGDTAELAATILEEGQNSPADIFFAQDAGALGALAVEGRLQTISEKYLEQVDSRLKSPEGYWLGTSGRARVVVYNTDKVEEEELPDNIWGFTEPEWEGRLGWAPSNGSFQAFVTALRVLEGEERAKEWLTKIKDNDPYEYHNNTSTVEGISRGEADVGFVNHYYLFRFIAEEGEDFPVRQIYTTGDAGSMINIAGIGILDVARNDDRVKQFVEFMLTEEAQQHFVQENNEYPSIKELEVDNSLLKPLEEIDAPDLDLTNIEDLEGTLELLTEVGAL